jgi:hypothetical protein
LRGILGNEEIEEQCGDDEQEHRARSPIDKAECAVERANGRIRDRIGQFHRQIGYDDENEEEDDPDHRRRREHILGDVLFGKWQQRRIEEIGARSCGNPGPDGQDSRRKPRIMARTAESNTTAKTIPSRMVSVIKGAS